MAVCIKKIDVILFTCLLKKLTVSASVVSVSCNEKSYWSGLTAWAAQPAFVCFFSKHSIQICWIGCCIQGCKKKPAAQTKLAVHQTPHNVWQKGDAILTGRKLKNNQINTWMLFPRATKYELKYSSTFSSFCVLYKLWFQNILGFSGRVYTTNHYFKKYITSSAL